MFRRSLTTASIAHRRPFITTSRLRNPNRKHPAGEPASRPPAPPGNKHNADKGSSNTGKAKEEQQESTVDQEKGNFDPRSPHFIFGFASSELSSEERSRKLLLITLATFAAWATETWMMPVGQDTWFPSREAYLVDLITRTIVQSRKNQEKETRSVGL